MRRGSSDSILKLFLEAFFALEILLLTFLRDALFILDI